MSLTGSSATGSVTLNPSGYGGTGGYGILGANGGAGGDFSETLMAVTSGSNSPVSIQQNALTTYAGQGGGVTGTSSAGSTVAGAGGTATGSATGVANGSSPVNIDLALQGRQWRQRDEHRFDRLWDVCPGEWQRRERRWRDARGGNRKERRGRGDRNGPGNRRGGRRRGSRGGGDGIERQRERRRGSERSDR